MKKDKSKTRLPTKRKRGMNYIEYDYEAAFDKNIDDLHEWFTEQLLKNSYKCVYACKEITAGQQFEIEIYPEFKRLSDAPGAGKKKDNSKAQKNLNDINARKYVTRLINENFPDDRGFWITLTYSKGNEPANYDEALNNIQNYIKRLKYRRRKLGLPPIRYVYITAYNPEAKIRWHHHIVMDNGLDMDTVETAWNKGRRNETRCLDPDEYGLAGIANYITDEKNRGKCEKRWNCSKNLKQFRVRKVYGKKKEYRKDGTAQGKYTPISKYINTFVRDRGALEHQIGKWYPGNKLLDTAVFYNDFNGMFYIKARMKKGKANETRAGTKHENTNHIRPNPPIAHNGIHAQGTAQDQGNQSRLPDPPARRGGQGKKV